MNISVLEQKKVSELHEIARRLGIENYADLRRRDLIYEILGAEADADAEGSDVPSRVGAASDDRPAVRPRERRAPASPRREPRRRRARGPRGPISTEWPDYMQAFDPYAVALEGLIRKTGVLEILPDGYGFLRSPDYSYLPSPDDIYVSPSQIKRFSLRVGDTVDGQLRPPKEGERFFALIRVHSINGRSPEAFDERTEFDVLTPTYPDRPVMLGAGPLAARVVDLVAPIGKGQRGLVIAPPKSGRTDLLQALADAVVAGEPDATVLVVLIDGRPEDVTDLQRAVPGAEVVASTFDQAPDRQVHVAELAFERARRLVEAGQDVVVFLDSLTRLARAYQAVLDGDGGAANGALSPAALRGPKRLLGSARAVEEGGSLTVIATVLVETGAAVDTAVYDAFHGTGTMELVLDADLARQGLAPAVDLAASATRREEVLVPPDRLARLQALRQSLARLPAADALADLLALVQATADNDSLLEDFA